MIWTNGLFVIRQKILFFIWFIQCHLAITMYVQLAWTQLFHYNNVTWALRRLKSSATQLFVVLTQNIKDPYWWSFMFGVNRRPMCSSHKDLTNTESVCTSWHHHVADNSSTWGLVQLCCGAFFINSLWPSDTIWRPRSGSTLDQEMADGTKPLPQPMLTYNQWGPVTLISVQFYKRYPSHQSLKLP